MPLPLEQQTNAAFKMFLLKCVTLLQSIKNIMFDLEVETERGALKSSPRCGSPAPVTTCNCYSCGTSAGSQTGRAAQLSLLPGGGKHGLCGGNRSVASSQENSGLLVMCLRSPDIPLHIYRYI